MCDLRKSIGPIHYVYRYDRQWLRNGSLHTSLILYYDKHDIHEYVDLLSLYHLLAIDLQLDQVLMLIAGTDAGWLSEGLVAWLLQMFVTLGPISFLVFGDALCFISVVVYGGLWITGRTTPKHLGKPSIITLRRPHLKNYPEKKCIMDG